MTKQLEALKPGKYAIRYFDNWDGEGDTYHTIANLEDDGRWLHDETGRELLDCRGDEILNVWPLDDGHETLALIAALEQAQQPQVSPLAVKLPTQEKYDDPLSAHEAIKDCAEAIRAAGGTADEAE
ncbi:MULTISPECIES: hypothetical protein [unclassified Cedecea]|uniref:hypothetical protein n=1 Tax=unclassified Cedecea TaxID=2649846 RepID=UPI0030165F1A